MIFQIRHLEWSYISLLFFKLCDLIGYVVSTDAAVVAVADSKKNVISINTSDRKFLSTLDVMSTL